MQNTLFVQIILTRACALCSIHCFCFFCSLFDQADRNKSKKISRDEFRTFALEVDAVQTALPPTAQVATQEGKYLGKLLSDHEMEISMNFMDHVVPFR